MTIKSKTLKPSTYSISFAFSSSISHEQPLLIWSNSIVNGANSKLTAASFVMDVREQPPTFVATEFAVFHYGGPTARGAQSPGTHSAPRGACAPRLRWRSRGVRPFKNQFRDPLGFKKALRHRISGNVCSLNKCRLDYLVIFAFSQVGFAAIFRNLIIFKTIFLCRYTYSL